MHKITICLSFIIGVLLNGCGKDTPQPDKADPTLSVAIKSIEVKDKELVMKPGQKSPISYTVLPAEATTKEVMISSSNTDVVTVSGKELTALKIGMADITIKSASGNVSVKIQVKVLPIDAAELKLDKTELELLIGERETLTATIVPNDASEKELVWKSNDPEIASVSSSGEIEAIAIGSTEIIVTTKDGKISTKATVLVKPVVASSIYFEQAEIIMGIQSTATIKATVFPENTTDKSLVWTSSSPSVVAIKGTGEVKALKAGRAVISASTKDGKVKATLEVSVKEDIDLLSGKIKFTLNVTQLAELKMQIYLSNASNKTVSIKKVECYVNGLLAATNLTDFTNSVGGETFDEWIAGFNQKSRPPFTDNFPPNWYAKVFFIQNGNNYAMSIVNDGFSIQRLHGSSIGINPDWDGENTTEIPSR